LAKLSEDTLEAARECLHSLRGVLEAMGAPRNPAAPLDALLRCALQGDRAASVQAALGCSGDVAEALVPSVHPTAYSALQAYPGLHSRILVSATLVYGYGQVDNHLKA